jgi:hypothetical protein
VTTASAGTGGAAGASGGASSTLGSPEPATRANVAAMAATRTTATTRAAVTFGFATAAEGTLAAHLNAAHWSNPTLPLGLRAGGRRLRRPQPGRQWTGKQSDNRVNGPLTMRSGGRFSCPGRRAFRNVSAGYQVRQFPRRPPGAPPPRGRRRRSSLGGQQVHRAGHLDYAPKLRRRLAHTERHARFVRRFTGTDQCRQAR